MRKSTWKMLHLHPCFLCYLVILVIMNTHIRHARHEDWSAIVASYNASIPSRRATADTEPVTVAARDLLPAVAEMDGREYDLLIMGRRVVAVEDKS